jgi:hypothetical protein
MLDEQLSITMGMSSFHKGDTRKQLRVARTGEGAGLFVPPRRRSDCGPDWPRSATIPGTPAPGHFLKPSVTLRYPDFDEPLTAGVHQ